MKIRVKGEKSEAEAKSLRDKNSSKTKRVFETKNFPSLRNFPNLNKILRQKQEISRDGNKIPRQKYPEVEIARVSRIEDCRIDAVRRSFDLSTASERLQLRTTSSIQNYYHMQSEIFYTWSPLRFQLLKSQAQGGKSYAAC
jgi:hypothetical protein